MHKIVGIVGAPLQFQFVINDVTYNTLQCRRCSIDHQCRINHVADVANATGLRPQVGLRK